MDVFGHYTDHSGVSQRRGGMEQAASGKRRHKKKRNDPLKIVYISSPMKVKTCESKFRSLVQELTGKDSQVAMLMEMSSSCVGDTEMCQPSAGQLRSSEVDRVVDKVEQWPVTLDQSLMTVDEQQGNYMFDETFGTGGGGGGCGWDYEFPWHLLMD